MLFCWQQGFTSVSSNLFLYENSIKNEAASIGIMFETSAFKQYAIRQQLKTGLAQQVLFLGRMPAKPVLINNANKGLKMYALIN